MTDADEIGDDELLYRKIAVKLGWFDPERNEVKPPAFKPTTSDTDGISVDRAHSEEHPDFRRIEEAAQGRQAECYIAVLRVGDLRTQGFEIIPALLPENPGHALIKDLNHGNRKDVQSKEKMVLLAQNLVVDIGGPFSSYIS